MKEVAEVQNEESAQFQQSERERLVVTQSNAKQYPPQTQICNTRTHTHTRSAYGSSTDNFIRIRCSHQAEVLSLKTALSAAESARRSTESEKAGLEELLEAVRAELKEAAVRRDGLMKRFTEAQKERLQADSAAQRQLEDRTTAFETERLQLEREWTERLEVLKRDLVRVASC